MIDDTPVDLGHSDTRRAQAGELESLAEGGWKPDPRLPPSSGTYFAGSQAASDAGVTEEAAALLTAIPELATVGVRIVCAEVEID